MGLFVFFFSSRRRHTRFKCDWSSDVCSSDLEEGTVSTGLQELPPEESVPSSLDWDHWLGAATMRPYSSWYVPYNWRRFLISARARSATGPLTPPVLCTKRCNSERRRALSASVSKPRAA